MNIAIAPFSNPLPSGEENPKNYPYWQLVIDSLHKSYPFVTFHQLYTDGDKRLNNVIIKKRSLSHVKKFVNTECNGWMSVDTYLPHLVNTKGIVIWGQSDPKIFGYERNVNLLRDPLRLREDQFGLWTQTHFNIDDWVGPLAVVRTFERIYLS